MNVRLRRLEADYERVRRVFRDHPRIRIQGVLGAPPEKYHVEYRIRGLENRTDGQIVEKNVHLVEIVLLRGYPRQAPQCRMLTPIFHPNIAPHAICIGDHWAAGESLAQLILRIGEMIAFQSYNTKSPLNGEAARWADQNQQNLPLDPVDLSISDVTVPRPVSATVPEGTICQNCSTPAAERPLTRCKNGHFACPECLLPCPVCEDTCCVLCSLQPCSVCGKSVCEDCLAACRSCQRRLCRAHLLTCHACGAVGCADCVLACTACGRYVCLDHVGQCADCQCVLCNDHALECPQCHRRFCSTHANPDTKLCRACQAQ